LLFIGALMAASPRALAADDKAATRPAPHKTDWLYNARWGVMYHYVSTFRPKETDGKELWDKAVKNFDIAGLAKQLHEVGAGYLLISAQHMGLPLAPNKMYEDGKYPTRDLIPELSDELAKYDIHLMLYYATGMGVTEDSPKNAAAVIEELSKRYGKKVKGWWLDNNSGNEKAQKLIADAARAGNGDTLVAFSPPKGSMRNSPYEDYTAGNEHAPGTTVCGGRFIQDCQWHMLTYLGYNWGGYTKYKGQPRFDAGKASAITGKLVASGGVVTWDTPWEVNGLLSPECLPILKAIGEAARQAKRETAEALGLPPKKPQAGPHKTDWLYNARWGMFYQYCPEANSEDKWEEAVKKFDVPALVKQIKDVGAGYFMISARSPQSAFPVAPGSDYKDGKFPSRDLVAEIADALAKEKIPLTLYFGYGDHAKAASVLKELSLRYGKKVSGWWIEAGAEYKALAEAARAGNAEALVAFAAGMPHVRSSEFEDFTSGRTNAPSQSICAKRFTDGLQWHTLGTLGFNKYQQRYDAGKASEITARHVTAGGVITWNTPHTPTGQIDPSWLNVVQAIGKTARELQRVEPQAEEAQIKNPKPPAPPKDAIATTLARVKARCISGKQDWWPERQEELGLVTSVGKLHIHFIRSQLLFDLSKVDKTKPLHSAVLYLYANLGPVGEPREQCNHLLVSRFTRGIEDRDQRWYVAPVATEGEQLWVITQAGALEIDVTEIVKAWLSGQPNYGFRLSNPGLGGSWQRYPIIWRTFESALYDAKENPKGPRLVIYQLPK
jgi:hypothetical protein